MKDYDKIFRYVDLAVKIIIALAATYIGWQANQISKQQVIIAEQQAEFMWMPLSPIISAKAGNNCSNGPAFDNGCAFVSFENTGGPIFDLDYKVDLSIVLYRCEPGDQLVRTEFPFRLSYSFNEEGWRDDVAGRPGGRGDFLNFYFGRWVTYFNALQVRLETIAEQEECYIFYHSVFIRVEYLRPAGEKRAKFFRVASRDLFGHCLGCSPEWYHSWAVQEIEESWWAEKTNELKKKKENKYELPFDDKFYTHGPIDVDDWDQERKDSLNQFLDSLKG